MMEDKQREDLKITAGQDPFNTLGFGLIAYRNTLFSLFITFLLCSIITYPVLQAFRAGTGYNEDKDTKYGRDSIGNLGYSSVQCSSIPYDMNQMTLTCPYGVMTGIVKNGVGINTPDLEIRDSCLVNDEKFHNKQCSD